MTERRQGGRHIPVPAVLAFAITASLGLLDESIQALLPKRFYDIIDVGFNAFAAFMAITASVAVDAAGRGAARVRDLKSGAPSRCMQVRADVRLSALSPTEKGASDG